MALGCLLRSLIGYICYSSHVDEYELRIDDGVCGDWLGGNSSKGLHHWRLAYGINEQWE